MERQSYSVGLIRNGPRTFDIIQVDGNMGFHQGDDVVYTNEYRVIGSVDSGIAHRLVHTLSSEHLGLAITPCQKRMMSAWRLHKESSTKTWRPTKTSEFYID